MDAADHLDEWPSQFRRFLQPVLFHSKIILNAPLEIRKAFYYGYYEADGSKTRFYNKDTNILFACKGKIGAMGLYYLIKSIGNTKIAVRIQNKKDDIYFIYNLKDQIVRRNKIRIMKELPKTENFVYDLETSLGRFHGGVGETIISNTDSVN